MWLHYDALHPYIYACLAILGFDHLLRLVKTRFCTAIVRPIPELGLTRIECPHINSGWRAGQHVRLRVMSTGMGLFGWAEVHPFTIASISNGPEGLILMCKKAGGWTSKLYNIASNRASYVEAGVGRTVGVVIEGPYGAYSSQLFYHSPPIIHLFICKAVPGIPCSPVILLRFL